MPNNTQRVSITLPTELFEKGKAEGFSFSRLLKNALENKIQLVTKKTGEEIALQATTPARSCPSSKEVQEHD